jgi:hypothetical protein
MDSTPPAAALGRPLTESEFSAVLAALVADLEEDFGPPECELPRRELSASEWAGVVERLSYRRAFYDEGEAPLPCLEEPGSEAKVRELRRRFKANLSLFGPRDRQLHTAVSPGRALAKLGDALAAGRHAEHSARGHAIAARREKRISLVNGRTCEGDARE